MYLYGSGFPKATDIHKQLLKKCTCGNMELYEAKQKAEREVRPVSEQDVSQTINPKDKQGEVLQSELSEQSIHGTMQREEPKESGKGRKERILEGGNNLEKTKGKLQGSDISKMSKGISSDGEKGRLHNATQTGNGSTSKEVADENGGGTSHRPQSEQQLNPEPCAICQQFLAQETRSWNGWKSHGLKPAYEPILVAVKPNDGTYANNAIKYGVAGLNIDGGRVGFQNEDDEKESKGKNQHAKYPKSVVRNSAKNGIYQPDNRPPEDYNPTGRFPANIILDEEAGKMLDEQSGESYSSGGTGAKSKGKMGVLQFEGQATGGFKDKGGASRFFYCAKASKSERNAGCEGLEEKLIAQGNQAKAELKRGNIDFEKGNKHNVVRSLKNHHPTVKPLALMEYLSTLTKTPTGGIVLDPFAGSGTTLIAAKNTGRDYIGIEREKEYVEITEARLKAIKQQKLL